MQMPSNAYDTMEKTIAEMIAEIHERFQKAIAENITVDDRLNALRRDFGTESTRIKQKLNNLGEALAILAKEATRAPANSTLKPEAHKQIMDLLNA